jgi:hypothetical protein
MLLLSCGGRRLEPCSYLRITYGNGTGGFMGKNQKATELWKMPLDFWNAIEKGMQHYTRNASQNNKWGASPFPGTFNNPMNLLRQAFREQDEIGWSGLFKGRGSMQWKFYMEQHLKAKGIKLKIQ